MRLFVSRYRLMEEHDRRLRTAPKPPRAALDFDRTLVRARKVERLRSVFFVALFFSFVSAAYSIAAASIGVVGALKPAVQVLAGLASSFTVVFTVGVAACSRLLGLYDLDLGYFSSERRMAATGAATKRTRRRSSRPRP